MVDGKGFAFGLSPIGAVLSLPAALVFLVPWLVVLGSLSADIDVRRLWQPLALGAGWALWLLAVALVGRLAYRGLFDLSHPASVLTGPVILLDSNEDRESSSCQVAMDSGEDVATRYDIDVRLYRQLRTDTWLRLEVTPKLGHLRRAEILDGGCDQPGRQLRADPRLVRLTAGRWRGIRSSAAPAAGGSCR